jgi:hypothetical protein
MKRKANASAKAKEVQPIPTRQHTVAPHLLLPNRTILVYAESIK